VLAVTNDQTATVEEFYEISINCQTVVTVTL